MAVKNRNKNLSNLKTQKVDRVHINKIDSSVKNYSYTYYNPDAHKVPQLLISKNNFYDLLMYAKENGFYNVFRTLVYLNNYIRSYEINIDDVVINELFLKIKYNIDYNINNYLFAKKYNNNG